METSPPIFRARIVLFITFSLLTTKPALKLLLISLQLDKMWKFELNEINKKDTASIYKSQLVCFLAETV